MDDNQRLIYRPARHLPVIVLLFLFFSSAALMIAGFFLFFLLLLVGIPLTLISFLFVLYYFRTTSLSIDRQQNLLQIKKKLLGIRYKRKTLPLSDIGSILLREKVSRSMPDPVTFSAIPIDYRTYYLVCSTKDGRFFALDAFPTLNLATTTSDDLIQDGRLIASFLKKNFLTE